MKISWNIVIQITVPILTLFIGFFLNKLSEKKTKVLFYFGHISNFRTRGESYTDVYTHNIILNNCGKLPANNLRIGHHILPSHYQIYPQIEYSINNLPDGAQEIVIQNSFQRKK